MFDRMRSRRSSHSDRRMESTAEVPCPISRGGGGAHLRATLFLVHVLIVRDASLALEDLRSM